MFSTPLSCRNLEATDIFTRKMQLLVKYAVALHDSTPSPANFPLSPLRWDSTEEVIKIFFKSEVYFNVDSVKTENFGKHVRFMHTLCEHSGSAKSPISCHRRKYVRQFYCISLSRKGLHYVILARE